MKYHILVWFGLLSGTLGLEAQTITTQLIDKDATPRTKALFGKLDLLSGKHVLFGQQDATAYGHTWNGDKNRSDVNDICGSHPAVIGTDCMGLTSPNPKEVEKAKQGLHQTIVETDSRGGIVTICWHSANPANDGSFYFEKTPIKAVPLILPGGEFHEKYKTYLNRIAEVAHAARDNRGEAIPVIFRPFHEFDGDWFWWGKAHCTADEFIQLWRFTINYLKTEKQVHNFIYAFSPDCRFQTDREYLERYPGDEYVDILGMDNYWDFRPDGANNPRLAEKKLLVLSRLAKEKGKLAALTETGLESVSNPEWYTQVLLPILKNKALRLTYILVWRNASDNPTHYYTPFPGHPAADDFKQFCADDLIWLESDLQSYRTECTGLRKNAETEMLDRKLKKLVEDKSIMFGMANPTTIGFASGPQNSDYNSSDCMDITGDHPAFHESDLMWYEENPRFKEWDMKAMKEAYKRGAVLGYCWHLRGPESGQFYASKNGIQGTDYTLAKEIVSNPNRRSNPKLDWYLTRIDSVAIPVFKELNCPLVFRPFHEMTGEWFWWGKQIGSECYQELFRLTVDYLRSKGINNLLYCWAPDKFVDFAFYPGDEYVDVLGLDIYEPGLSPIYPKDKLIENLTLICDYAAAHNKVAAWTEVGCRPTEAGISRYPEQHPDFWTTYVWDVVTQHPQAGRLAWITSWYNADWKRDDSSSPFIPYKGMKKKNARKAIKDFKKMYAYPNSVFEKDIKKIKAF